MVVWVAWLGAVWCALIAVVRLGGWEDHWFLLIGLVGLLPIAMLPAYFALGVGFWRRRWLLAALSALLVASHLAWTLPDTIPHGRRTAGVPVRIYSHNILNRNTKSAGVARDIRQIRPDVVVLLELSRRNMLALEAVLKTYPYRLVQPDIDGAFGFGIWSRLPFDQTRVVQVSGFPIAEVTLHAASQSVRLFAVHTVAPVNNSVVPEWRSELNWLRQAARNRGDVRIIMAGDFNATRQNRDFRRLLDAGLQDAHSAVGGWAPTWPKTWW